MPPSTATRMIHPVRQPRLARARAAPASRLPPVPLVGLALTAPPLFARRAGDQSGRAPADIRPGPLRLPDGLPGLPPHGTLPEARGRNPRGLHATPVRWVSRTSFCGFLARATGACSRCRLFPWSLCGELGMSGLSRPPWARWTGETPLPWNKHPGPCRAGWGWGNGAVGRREGPASTVCVLRWRRSPRSSEERGR